MNRRNTGFVWFLGAWTALTVLFVLLPLLVLLAVSLTSRNYISLPTDGFSLRWYRQLLGSGFMTPAWNSVVLAAEAATTTVALGTLAALAISKWRFPLRTQIRFIITSPVFVPTILLGLAILVFFASFGWTAPSARLYVAHTVLTLPYAIRTVGAALVGIDVNQQFAAQNLGATPLAVFRLITLPQIRAGIFAATLFAFIVSFDNVAVSVFLTAPSYNTLPVKLLEFTSTENDPSSAALSVVLIVASLAMVAVAERIVGIRQLMS